MGRIARIKELRESTAEAMTKTQAMLTKNIPKQCFAIGQQVWLEGTNLRLPYQSMKLAPKRYGPFLVTALIGETSYQLELPPSWKLHPVFHGSLLTPYKETLTHGRNFIEPPPDIIEGEPEWEVERILRE